MSKIAVGDKVVIRDDLEVGQNVGGVVISENYLPYLGSEITVTRTEVLYQGDWFIAEGSTPLIFSADMTIREAEVSELYVYIRTDGGKPMLFERELSSREVSGNNLKFSMKLDSGKVADVISEMMAKIELKLRNLFGD